MSGLFERWKSRSSGLSRLLCEPLLAVALEHLEPVIHPGTVVLDVGIGEGHISWVFAQAGASVVGIDVDWPRVRTGVDLHPGVRFLLGEAEYLPFRDGCIDCLFCFSVLQYAHRESVLAECRRILKPGARYAVVENLEGNPIARLYRAWKRVSRSGYPRNMTPREHLRWKDISLFHRYFSSVDYRAFHVLAPGMTLFSLVPAGPLSMESTVVRLVGKMVRRMDDRLIQGFPSATASAWMAVIYGVR